MLDKDLIKTLFDEGYTFAEIARELEVSRQRIHQIIKNYTNTGLKDREKKYAQISKVCEDCGVVRTLLHHRDGNNQNEAISNLKSMCNVCHIKIHTGIPREGNKQRHEHLKKEYPDMKIATIRDASRNFYEVMPTLNKPVLITKYGNPIMRIDAISKSYTPLNGGAMFEAQSMSVFNSQGFSQERSEDLAEKMRKVFEQHTTKNTTTGEEVQNEEKHAHNPS